MAARRGVHHGDIISPKLLTLALENILKEVQWERKCINIDGTFLHHLFLADDVLLISGGINELKSILEDLTNTSVTVGLEINTIKI